MPDQLIDPTDVSNTLEPASPVTPDETVDTAKPGQEDGLNKVIEKRLAIESKQSKEHRRQFAPNWKRNIELRLGKPVTTAAIEPGGDVTEALDDELRSEINPDWYLTKTKTANLFSRVPAVRGTHENTKYAKAVPLFMKELNYQLSERRANIGVPMEEALNDVVNASGIAGILVGYAARFEEVIDPSIPKEALAQFDQKLIASMVAEKKLPTVPRAVSDKFFANRMSPGDLLWPKEFKGSCFDNAPWVGYTGEKMWAEALVDFELNEADKAKYVSGKESEHEDDLTVENDRGIEDQGEKVFFDHIFYWRYLYDPEEKNMKAIWEVVFVHGSAEPVLHRPSNCQKLVEGSTNQYVGACKFPLQILTLTYVTDNPVPPSDTEAGRPQVNDLRLSRSQMFQNRKRSTPLRWYDVNRTNKDVQMMLMRGDVQGFIPTNGSGDKVIGEIARASYPTEDRSFDAQTMQDLERTWQIGGNQMGISPQGERTKAEVTLTQENFSTRIGQERARVTQFFLNIVEVMASYIALYSDFNTLTDEERQQMMEAWDSKQILQDLVFSIRPDSSIVMDAASEYRNLAEFFNLMFKTGYMNPLPTMKRMAELRGLDPDESIIQPQPQKEDNTNISYRFSGKDDLMNPMVVAMLIKEDKAPSPEQLKAAKTLLEAIMAMPAQQPMGAGGPMQPEGPQAVPEGGVDAHPNAQLASKIAQRSEDM